MTKRTMSDGPSDSVGCHGLLTLRQACAYLSDGQGNGPAFETLRYLVHRVRLIPKYRFGRGRGLTYVKKADLDALVARGFQPAVGPDLRLVPLRRTSGERS